MLYPLKKIKILFTVAICYLLIGHWLNFLALFHPNFMEKKHEGRERFTQSPWQGEGYKVDIHSILFIEASEESPRVSP